MDKYKIITIILSLIIIFSIFFWSFKYIENLNQKINSLSTENEELVSQISSLNVYKEEIILQTKKMPGMFTYVCTENGSPFGPPIGGVSNECLNKFVGLYFSCELDGTQNIYGDYICVCDIGCKINIKEK